MHTRTSRVVADKFLVLAEPEPWVWYLIAGLSALALICALTVVILLCLRCRRKKKKAQQAQQPSFYDEPPHSASKFRKSDSNLSHHHNAPAPYGPPPPLVGYNSAFRPPSATSNVAAVPPVIIPVPPPAVIVPTTGGTPVVLTHLGGHHPHKQERRGTKTIRPDVIDNDGYIKEKAETILLPAPTLPAPAVTSVAAQAAHIQQTDTWSIPAYQIPLDEPAAPPAPQSAIRRSSYRESRPEPKRLTAAEKLDMEDGVMDGKHFGKKIVSMRTQHKVHRERERERTPPPPPPPQEETDFETTEFETTDAEPIRREIVNYVPPTRVETEVHLPARVVEVPVYEESPPQYVVVRERMTESQYQQMLLAGGPDAANHVVKSAPQLLTTTGGALPSSLYPSSVMQTSNLMPTSHMSVMPTFLG